MTERFPPWDPLYPHDLFGVAIHQSAIKGIALSKNQEGLEMLRIFAFWLMPWHVKREKY